MRNKLLCLLLCLAVILSAGAPAITALHTYTVAEAESLCDGIVGCKDGVSAQHFIDNGLCGSAGVSAEFYIIALSQQGSYNFSSYETSLTNYLNTHEIRSATTREKYALALIAAGSNSAYITKTADEAIGDLGLMSLVFGLHILNNGYKSKLYTTDGLINTILGYQLSDGGWAVIGDRGDVDVTAMTIQSLAPYYYTNSNIRSAVDRGLKLLSDAQQSNGGFYGMGTENCESAAQVLTALSDLGIDPNTDSRFIKNGCSVIDAIMGFCNADGSFCHVAGGGASETATMEAFYAITAYIRYCRGKGSLYVLDNRHPSTVDSADDPAEDPQNNGNSQNRSDNQSYNTPQNNNSNNSNNSGGDTPQNSDDHNSGDQNNANDQPQQNIIYINGQPQIKATEKSTKKPTEATAATQSPTAATEISTESPTIRDAGKGAGIFQPTGEATEPPALEEEQPANKGSYKPYAIGGILAAAVIAALILFLLKKRNKKHYIAVGIIAAAGVLFILLTNFESAESYHTVTEKADASGAVTISVRCDVLKDDEKPDYIPDDCIILDETIFAVAEGDTVYDILIEASKRCDFQVDNRGAAGNAYIAGIEYLYEYDYGDLSGWMYKVDGEFPDVGCQNYVLSGGETIEWLYTKDIGKDLD